MVTGLGAKATKKIRAKCTFQEQCKKVCQRLNQIAIKCVIDGSKSWCICSYKSRQRRSPPRSPPPSSPEEKETQPLDEKIVRDESVRKRIMQWH
ncbi:hypothetical protein U1Q18_002537 [Sarracenia purpurea var. burkii]